MKVLSKAPLLILIMLNLLSVHSLSAQLLQRIYKPLGWPPKVSKYQHLPHFQDGEFQNPIETSSASPSQGLPLLVRHFTSEAEKAPNPYYRFKEQALATVDTAALQLNWLGHAAVLIKSGDTYILTDPMLTGRASPTPRGTKKSFTLC